MGTDVGFGVTFVFGTSGFTAEYAGDVQGPDMSRDDVDMTSHSSTEETVDGRKQAWADWLPSGVVDAGETTVDINFDPDDTIGTSAVIPINAPRETITITFRVPDSGAAGATFVGLGYIKAASHVQALRGKMSATITIKWSGKPTWTAST